MLAEEHKPTEKITKCGSKV